jgi:hypothetical protein
MRVEAQRSASPARGAGGRGGATSPARGWSPARSSLLDRSRAMSAERSRGGNATGRSSGLARSPARTRSPDRRSSLALRAGAMSARPESPARASLRRAQEMSSSRGLASRASHAQPLEPHRRLVPSPAFPHASCLSTLRAHCPAQRDVARSARVVPASGRLTGEAVWATTPGTGRLLCCAQTQRATGTKSRREPFRLRTWTVRCRRARRRRTHKSWSRSYARSEEAEGRHRAVHPARPAAWQAAWPAAWRRPPRPRSGVHPRPHPR